MIRIRLTRNRLTVITHGDATVHGIADKRHNDPEEGQKDPILAEPCAGMFPDESQQS